MFSKDGCVWPDYETYKLDCKLSKQVNTYKNYRKRHKHRRRLTYRLIDELNVTERVYIREETKKKEGNDDE